MLADEAGCRHGGHTQPTVIYLSATVPRLSLYITEGIIRVPSSRGGGGGMGTVKRSGGSSVIREFGWMRKRKREIQA